jgi:ferredoxin
MPVVVKERCPQNHPCPCISLCPVDALSQNGFEAPTIDKDSCIECGACVNSCPYQALTDDEYREKERSISP